MWILEMLYVIIIWFWIAVISWKKGYYDLSVSEGDEDTKTIAEIARKYNHPTVDE